MPRVVLCTPYFTLILALCAVWQAAPAAAQSNKWKSSAVYRKQEFDRAVTLDKPYTQAKCRAIGATRAADTKTVTATSRSAVTTLSRVQTVAVNSTSTTTISTDTTLIIPTLIATDTTSTSTYFYTQRSVIYETSYDPSTSTSYSVASTTTLPNYVAPTPTPQRMRQKIKRQANTTADIDNIFVQFAKYDMASLLKQCSAILPKMTSTSTILSVIPTTRRVTSTTTSVSSTLSTEYTTYTSTAVSTSYNFTKTVFGGYSGVPLATVTTTYTRTSPTVVASVVATVTATYEPLATPYYVGCPRPTDRDARPVQYHLSYNKIACAYMTWYGPYSRSLTGFCEWSQADGSLTGTRNSPWCAQTPLTLDSAFNGTYPWKLPNSCPVEADGHLLVTDNLDFRESTRLLTVWDDAATAPIDYLSYLSCVYSPTKYCVYTFDTGLLQTKYGGGVGCPPQARAN